MLSVTFLYCYSVCRHVVLRLVILSAVRSLIVILNIVKLSAEQKGLSLKCESGMSKIAIREKINGTGWDGTGRNEIEW